MPGKQADAALMPARERDASTAVDLTKALVPRSHARARWRPVVACLRATLLGLALAVVLHALLSLIPGRLPRGSKAGADTAGDGLLVVTISDWGGVPFYPYVTPAQLAVRDAMSKAVLASPASAKKLVLALGDNFYFTGVTSAEDPRFKRTFEQVYFDGHPELSGDDMWRLVAGNRAHCALCASAGAAGRRAAAPARARLTPPPPPARRTPAADDYYATRDVRPQIAYTNHSRAWHFPAQYYTFSEPVGGGRVAQFVLVDTVLLSVGRDGILEGAAEQARSDAHWAWLGATLAASRADYLVVGGHYPVWSVCSHGPTPVLVERLRPLLAAHRASAYFSGHDHCAQAFVDGGVHHHGVGGAHLLNYGARNMKAVPQGSLAFFFGASVWPVNVFKGAFATASFGPRAMTVTHYDSDGRVLSSLGQAPRDPVAAWAAP